MWRRRLKRCIQSLPLSKDQRRGIHAFFRAIPQVDGLLLMEEDGFRMEEIPLIGRERKMIDEAHSLPFNQVQLAAKFIIVSQS